MAGKTLQLTDKWCIKNDRDVARWFNKQLLTTAYTYLVHRDNYLHSYNIRNESVTIGKYAGKSFSEPKPRADFTVIDKYQFELLINSPSAESIIYDINLLKNII